MNRIYKYEFELKELVDIQMPISAKILSMQYQNGKPCIWAIVDPNAEKEIVTLLIYGTGEQVTYLSKKKYVTTLQNGMFVWHVFKQIKE